MELLQTLEPMTAIIMLGMIAGIVELIKQAFDKEWRACVIIIGAGITGALTALALGADPLMGAVVGFAASGYITIAQNVGKEQI